MHSARRSTRLLSIAALLLVVVAVFVRFDPLGLRADGELVRALTQRGRVAVVDAKSLLGLHAQGATLVDAASVPGLLPALAGQDADALSRALEQARVSALLIEPELAASGQPSVTLRARLQRFGRVPGLHGLFLSRTAVLYAPDLTRELSPLHREALATVARALVAGARPPRVSSFPEPLRRLRPVEVMVLLRSGDDPRLWRSARGSSIASALITAATVARERWHEREQAMGGTLDRALPRLTVDVALLDDDGTLGERDAAFIDRALFPACMASPTSAKAHGVTCCPDAAREEGKGRASQAFRKLFVDDGLPEDSFGRHELRLYRLAVQTLATSPDRRRRTTGCPT